MSFDGRAIVEPVEYQEISGASGAYKKSDTWTQGTTEVTTGSSYTWRMYYSGVKIHNIDLQMNKGRERVFDLAAIKLNAAVKVLRKALATDAYASNDDTDASERMVGIGAFTGVSATVGGIDQGTYTWWRGFQDTSGSNRDLTWTLLNKMYHYTKRYGNFDPATLIVTTEGVLQNYENTLTASSASVPTQLVQFQMAMGKGPKTIDGGFTAFSFKNVPMVADPYCTANCAYFLNEAYIHWRVLKAFEDTGWTQLRVNGQDWVQNTIFGYGAFTSSANNKLGMISDLTEA